MGICIPFLAAVIFLWCFVASPCYSSRILTETHNPNHDGVEEIFQGEIMEVKSGPEDVVWVVQFSDLHFSVHHPERAQDFQATVGRTLSVINPSLVLITGDLTGMLLHSYYQGFFFSLVAILCFELIKMIFR